MKESHNGRTQERSLSGHRWLTIGLWLVLSFGMLPNHQSNAQSTTTRRDPSWPRLVWSGSAPLCKDLRQAFASGKGYELIDWEYDGTGTMTGKWKNYTQHKWLDLDHDGRLEFVLRWPPIRAQDGYFGGEILVFDSPPPADSNQGLYERSRVQIGEGDFSLENLTRRYPAGSFAPKTSDVPQIDEATGNEILLVHHIEVFVFHQRHYILLSPPESYRDTRMRYWHVVGRLRSTAPLWEVRRPNLSDVSGSFLPLCYFLSRSA